MPKKDISAALEMNARDTGSCSKEFDFTAPAELVRAETEKALRDIAGAISVPGFRRGKVPAAIIRAKYADELGEELNRRFLSAAFGRVADDENIDIVSYGVDGEPKAEADKEFKFTLKIEVAPAVTLPDYKKIEVKGEVVKVADADVEERVNYYRNMYATYADVEEAAKEGDLVKVNYTSDFELPADASASLRRQAAAENSFIWLNEPELIPGAIKALTGAVKDAAFEFTAVYPEDYREADLAGKTVHYKGTVIGVQRKKEPTDAELCEKVKVAGLDELRKTLRESLEEEKKNVAKGKAVDAVFAEIDAKVDTFELPPSILEGEVVRELRRFAGETVKSEADAEAFKGKVEEHRKTAEETAKKALRKNFIVRAVARAEKIEVAQAELDQRIAMMSRYYGYKPKEFRAMLDKSGSIENVQFDLLSEKVMSFLADNAIIK